MRLGRHGSMGHDDARLPPHRRRWRPDPYGKEPHQYPKQSHGPPPDATSALDAAEARARAQTFAQNTAAGKGFGRSRAPGKCRQLLLQRGEGLEPKARSRLSLPLVWASSRPEAKSLRWSDFRREGHESYARMAGGPRESAVGGCPRHKLAVGTLSPPRGRESDFEGLAERLFARRLNLRNRKRGGGAVSRCRLRLFYQSSRPGADRCRPGHPAGYCRGTQPPNLPAPK
jgi:hypothetical protein